MRSFSTVASLASLWILVLAASCTLAQSQDQNTTLVNNFSNCVNTTALDGNTTIITQQSPNYDAAILNTNFRTVYQSLAIVYPASVSQVQAVIYCAQVYNLTAEPRGGGHNYEGLPSDIIIDMSRFNRIDIDVGNQTAVVGAGVRLGPLYSAVAEKGFAFPAGTCPTVGLAGHLQGGGFGLISRYYGLALDNLVGARVVLADQSVVDVKYDDEIFWGIRGAGGYEFCVVIDFIIHLSVLPTPNMTWYTIGYPFANAKQVIEAWQSYAPYAPDELYVSLFVGNTGVTMNIVYIGNATSLASIFQASPLAQLPNATAIPVMQGSFIEEVAFFGPSTVPGLATATQDVATDFWKGASMYVRDPLNSTALDALLEPLKSRGYIIMDPYGGFINRIVANSTAFGHRNMSYSIQFQVTWNESSQTNDNLKWMSDYVNTMFTYEDVGAYINYIDDNIIAKGSEVYGPLYWGDNWERLRRLKTKYDPKNFFKGYITRLNDTTHENNASPFENSAPLPSTSLASWMTSTLMLGSAFYLMMLFI